ncbi:MAG: NAD(P)H-dependent glycerol-3-phosphate dehydrogenase [Gemmatimonadales bacterium]|nr:NAD(P)H-dependent glycerol-3-phosphate dehydrogenase [Gemmatimonadales bacterium]
MTGPTVAVLGAGSWGTTLADLLARKGLPVVLWAYEPAVAESINQRHENALYLAGCQLDARLRATTDAAAAVRGADVVVSASPSHVVRGVLTSVAGAVGAPTVVASATKGIETDTLALMSDVAAEALPGRPFVALSGPSFAQEVYQGQPTAVVAASADPAAALAVQQLFATGYFRVYSNRDVVGTELAGALKNVIAIAAGILEGLGLGNNPRAALITRGLAEMSRLGAALGADPRTFAGLAGMGDLILTTCGALSRNRALGVAVAGGETLEHHRSGHRTVAEGANTARAAVRLAARHGVEMPICEKVAEVLFENKPPRQAIAELMERTLKPEQGT